MTLCVGRSTNSARWRGGEDTVLVLNAISGPDRHDLACTPCHLVFDAAAAAKGLRVGYFPAWMKEAGDRRRSAALNAVRKSGMTVVKVSLRDWPYDASVTYPRRGFIEVSEARSDWAPDPMHPLPKFSPPRRVPHSGTLIGRLFEEVPSPKLALPLSGP